ncbi:MAG: MotA/TolQ/ExbB proton channel family protein [bacterium]
MDIATVLGVVGAFGVIIASIIVGGSASTFVNVPSLIVVIGGTAAVTLSQISLAQFLGSIKVGLGAFMYKISSPGDLITEAVELANVARKEGLLALEGKQIEDPFLDKGIKMCIDGHAADMIQKMLTKDINLSLERQANSIKMFKSVEVAAPAMGMIGTLIGLVQMLANMDDPKSIGPAMAVALLTTLYGAVIANAIAMPIGEKLKAISAQERLNKMLILESIAAIQDGTNPRILQQLLLTFLPEDKRDSVGK